MAIPCLVASLLGLASATATAADSPIRISVRRAGETGTPTGEAKKENALFHEGDKLEIRLESGIDGYLRVYQVGADGAAAQLHPLTPGEAAGRIRAGEIVTLPLPGAAYEIRVGPPFGKERLGAIVSAWPIPGPADRPGSNLLPFPLPGIPERGQAGDTRCEIPYETAPRPATATARRRDPAVREVDGVVSLVIHLRVFFETGASAIESPRDQFLLRELAEAVKRGNLAGRRLRIEGHADARGSRTANLRLSEARARAVAEFLRRQGVPSEHLIPDGRGAFEPLSHETTGEAHALNRRVEIRLIDPAGPRTPIFP